jgi:hypothetical protein
MKRRTKLLKQWLRRVPGIMPARRRVLRKARNSTAMRRMVQKVFAVDTASAVPVDVTAGRVIGGVGTESLPVVLVVVVGADVDTLEEVVDETARLQLLSAGFRPVIVTDVDAFAAIRRYGYPVELLIDREAWAAQSQSGLWEEYVRDRIGLLFATYRATASVSAGPTGFDDAARLLLSAIRSAGAVAPSE